MAYRLRANALYDFDLPDSGFIRYFGMSIGLDVPHIMPGGIGVGLATDPRTRVFAYEFLAGADYAILPDVKLGAQYRFLGTSDIDPTTHASLASSHGSLNDQRVILTLRYDWGASPVAPPLRASPPALQPVAQGR